MENDIKGIDRREFLKRLGLGAAAVAGVSLAGCGSPEEKAAETAANGEIPTDKMEYRKNPKTGEAVSLLGYGCMRWPTVADDKDGGERLDQEQINRLVDYAIGHGVNYFDTSPAYCQGKSEEATGIALSRHPREKYFIATKMSNFHPSTWTREASIGIYRKSLEYLRTDHIDYMLLHCIGMGANDLSGKELTGMEAFKARFEDNGILDFLVEERAAGRIRNLGFSYHGDIEVYDYLLSQHDKYKWDFVQIQVNYVDWLHAKEINPRNTNGEYLYGELEKRGIPAVIMEPLLGGRLAHVPEFAQAVMKQRSPEASIASWAFRYAGTPRGVLTVLSGMTYMEHLQDNLRTYAPFTPCSEEELAMLHEIGDAYVDKSYVPCTNCQYCMPCPYGIDIPSIFHHYNKMITEGWYEVKVTDEEYAKARRAYLVGYDRTVPKLRQANHCIGCGKCVAHCPQKIKIPHELHRIDRYVEELKRGGV